MGHRGSGGRPEQTGGAASGTSDQDGIAATIGGEGSATGDDTLATGYAALELVDYGPVTVVWGSATVYSAAASPDGVETAAYADTYGSVAGADFVFTFSADVAGGGSGPGGTTETAASATHIFALDVEDFDLPGGTRMIELDLDGRVRGFFVPDAGNRSVASASVDAEGDSTYTLALADSQTTGNSSYVAVETYGLIA